METRKCIAFAFVLCHLENTPSHINKNRELKQLGRECQQECYKTIDLITEYNNFTWECNHLAHRSPENKRSVGICWAKSLTGFKLDATYANIMQHKPTWCTNERNMLRPTCWHNMLRSFARVFIVLKLIECKITLNCHFIPGVAVIRCGLRCEHFIICMLLGMARRQGPMAWLRRFSSTRVPNW